MPSDPVLLRRSEPARSTTVRRALRYTLFFLAGLGELMFVDYVSTGFGDVVPAVAAPSFSTHLCSTNTLSTACERLEFLFIPVTFTFRRLIPYYTYANNYSFVFTWIWVKPCTKIPVLGSSLICRFWPLCCYRDCVDTELLGYRIGDMDGVLRP